MKSFLIPIAAIVLTFFSSCSEEKQIRKTAFGYLDAMGNYRISEAYPFATQETQNTTLKYIEESILPNTDQNYIKSETPATITITNVSITSDSTATVMFHKSTPSSERNNILNLVKRDGKWQADVRIDVPEIIKKSDKNLHFEADTSSFRNIKLRRATDSVPPPPRFR